MELQVDKKKYSCKCYCIFSVSVFDPETMRPTTMMTATLSFDQRFVDDATAAEFMSVFRTLIERPELQNRGFLSSVKPDRLEASL